MTAFRQIAEKRLEKRWGVDKQGSLFSENDPAPQACRVLDWSARGAKVEVLADHEVPYQFTLSIDFGKSIMATARCHRVWTAGTVLGVQFEEELEFDVDTGTLSRG